MIQGSGSPSPAAVSPGTMTARGLRASSRRIACRRNGFTLIELTIVVAVVAFISAIVLPAIMKMRDRAKKKALAAQVASEETKAQERGRFTQPKGEKPIIDQADLDLLLASSYHRIGTKIYTRYEARCGGKVVFHDAGATDEPLLLFIPFPRDTTEARDVSLTFKSPSDKEPQKPENVTYHQQGIYWSGAVPKGELITAEVAFVALGRERFEYDLPPARQLREIDISLSLDGGGATRIPDHALQPTEIGKGRLGWRFTNLVSDRSIIIEIPGAQSPIGRVMLLCRLVAVAVLLFGAGFWYLSEQVKPGQLDDFRWGHFLLLAMTYSLFFVIFAVIVFHGSIGTAPAMVVAAVFSFPLLLLHAWRIIDLKFAATRVLPLAVFTLGLVVNGVYGGGARDYAVTLLRPPG